MLERDLSAARLLSIRRYPVKSMGGEYLETATLDRRGIVGDRMLAVVDENGHFASGKNTKRFRRRDGVFDYTARTLGDQVAVTRGNAEWIAGTQQFDAELSEHLGTTMTIETEGRTPHQDAGQLSLVGTASLEWCRTHLDVDADPRRIRVNLVIETEEPFIEETWVARRLSLGSAQLEVAERIERCRTVDLAQDGVPTTTPWLKRLAGDRRLCLGVYADVMTPGDFRVGDELSIA